MSFWLVSLPNLIPPDSTGFHRNDQNPAGISGALIRALNILQFFMFKSKFDKKFLISSYQHRMEQYIGWLHYINNPGGLYFGQFPWSKTYIWNRSAKYNLNKEIFWLFQLDSWVFQPESSGIPEFQPESMESGQNQWRNGKYCTNPLHEGFKTCLENLEGCSH